MIEVLRQFHFLRPWWLLALLLLPLLGWLGMRRGAAQRELARLVDAALLPHLLTGRAAGRALPTGLLLAACVLCTLALAGPAWNRVAQPLYASRAAQVVAISLSQHMLARDVAPSRLDRARYKAHALLDANRDGLNALVGYAGEAFVVAPLTADADSLGDLLDAMAPDTMPVDGDNAALAIERGAALIHDARAGGGSLVLICDQADPSALAAARAAMTAGVQVSVLGIGTAQGGPVPLDGGGFLHDAQNNMVLARRDDAALAALAKAGGGRYVMMTADAGDVAALHAQLRAGAATEEHGRTGDQWQDLGPWLLLPLLLIVAAGFRRGWLLVLPLALLPLLPLPAHAGTWQNLWQRRDQQAASALQHGQPKQAQKLARSPAWRGAAAYRAGDYPAAAAALQHADGSDAAYNLGNALARQRQYPQALAAYDRALKLDPRNADAIANRNAVQDWLRKQPQKPSSDEKKPQDKNAGSGKPSGDGQGKQDPSGAKKPGAQSSHDDSGTPDKPSSAPASASSQQQAADGNGKPADQPRPLTPAQQAQQQAQARQAQQALQRQMDRALSSPRPGQPSAHQLGAAASDDPQSKLPADLRHALQRVPDDPGALLRRKFQLEYQRRHGDVPDEENQP